MEKDTNIVPEEQEQTINTIEITEESKKKTLSFAKKTRIIGCILIGFLVIGCITYLWRPLNPEDESLDSSYRNIIYSSSNDDNTYLSCPDDNHPHMIDLGLPSGTKWACCNVGARIPEATGGYYAWGETKEKKKYSLNTYSFFDDTRRTIYDIGSSICGTQYDVAYMEWGDPWEMPSLEQIEELIDNCYTERTEINDFKGYQFIGSNGGSIFLPAAGGYKGSDCENRGLYGYFWSGTLVPDQENYASHLNFYIYEDKANFRVSGREYGFPVRPVATNEKIAEVKSSDFKALNGKKEKTLISCSDDNHPHKIDLGLPSGTKWACCNVDANAPEEYGAFYAWGETEVKDVYEWSNYSHCDGSLETCYDLGSNISGTQYDVAHVKWGDSWQMPSLEQIKELIDNSFCKWTDLNGIKGRKFISKNGGSIFFPIEGDFDHSLYDRNYDCWSGELCRFTDAYILWYNIANNATYGEIFRKHGLTVRPVAP